MRLASKRLGRVDSREDGFGVIERSRANNLGTTRLNTISLLRVRRRTGAAVGMAAGITDQDIWSRTRHVNPGGNTVFASPEYKGQLPGHDSVYRKLPILLQKYSTGAKAGER
jgi:hypothetical protein